MSNIKATEKPVRKKTARKAATKKAATTKTTKASAPKAKAVAPKMSTTNVSNSQREQLIREMAYYKAEKRGFNGGNAEQDWLEAEAEVDQLVGA